MAQDWADKAAEDIFRLYRDSTYFKSFGPGHTEQMLAGWASAIRKRKIEDNREPFTGNISPGTYVTGGYTYRRPRTYSQKAQQAFDDYLAGRIGADYLTLADKELNEKYFGPTPAPAPKVKWQEWWKNTRGRWQRVSLRGTACQRDSYLNAITFGSRQIPGKDVHFGPSDPWTYTKK